MPFIASQFLRRELGDRSKLVPDGLINLAFVRQLCEVYIDPVFYRRVLGALRQMAVPSLLGLKRKLPPVSMDQCNPPVLYRAFKTLHEIGK